MRMRWLAWFVALPVLCAGVRTAHPDESAPDKAAAKKVAYLKKHALPIRTHDPADDDFADLQPLKKLWKDVRIVQLGEETHGDGACFLAKTRLIKFLHQEMGFDVLAFESGLYDCAKAWEALCAPPGGKFDPVEAMKQGVFGIWMQSHEVKPLARYLHGQAHTKRPLELCGFDCQLTGTASRRQLAVDIAKVMGRAIQTTAPVDHQKNFQAMVDFLGDEKVGLDAKDRDARLQDLANLETALRGEAPVAGLDARTRAWWAQVCASLAAQVRNVVAQREGAKNDTWGYVNRRDAQMGKNMVWLGDEHYKDRKIIVWAATFHIIRNAPKLTSASVDYTNVEPMGHRVAKHFGKACYTLGFTAYEGEIGRPWTRPSALSRPAAGTFEHWMQQAGHDEAIVDLRTPASGGSFLQQPFTARPLGYGAMRGDGWHDVLDGLYFQRVMTPSTRSGYEPPPKVDDLTPLLDEQWATIRSGLSRGNMWANKWTLEEAFRDWMRGARPSSSAEIEAQEKVVRDWLAKQQEGEEAQGLPWRVQWLLADMAAQRNDGKAEQAGLLAAMGMFPEKDLRQPAKVSQYQHMANRYAWSLMQSKGFRKATSWFTKELAKERRFRYAYLEAWEDKLDEKQMDKLKDAVRKAYKQRKKRFKDLGGEIDGFLQALR